MKKNVSILIILIILLLTASLSYAQGVSGQGVSGQGVTTGVVVVAPPAGGFCDGAVGDFCDDVDATAGVNCVAGDGSSNCRVVHTLVTQTGDTVNFQATGLDGTYGWNIQAGTASTRVAVVHTSITSTNVGYCYARVKAGTVTFNNTSNSIPLLALRSSDGGKYCRAALIYDGALRLKAGSAGDGSGTSAFIFAANTTNHVWWEDGGTYCTVFASTSGTKGSYISRSGHDATASYTEVGTYANYDSTYGQANNVTFDDVKCRTTSGYGNNGSE